MAFGSLRGTLAGNASSITNPMDATGSVAVSVGDLIFVVISQQTNLTATGASDNLGNSYSAQNAGSDPGAVTGRAFWSRVTNAGTLTTVSVATTSSNNDVAVVAAAFEGPFATSPLDANPANETTDVTSPLTCPATGTLTQSDELVVCWGSSSNGAANAWAATSPNLEAVEQNNFTPACAVIGYQVVASTTSVAPEFTRPAGDPSVCVLGTASFKKASTGVTLAADAGSYTITGTAASLEYGRVIAAGAGSYTTTGTDASLERGLKVAAGAGSYAVSGSAAGLSITAKVVAAGAGSYAVTGSAAGLSITAKVLAAGAGSYAISGTDASLERARVVAAGAGSYAVSGTDAGLSITAKVVSAGAGSYAISGTDASLESSRVVAAGAGSYAVSGTDAALSITAKVMSAGAGSYAISGSDAALVYEPVGQITLAADAGSYAITGVDAALSITAKLLAADAGSYAIVGSDASLVTEVIPEPEPEPEPVFVGGGGGPGGGRRARRLRKKFRDEMSTRHLLLAEWDNAPLKGYALELKERFDRIIGVETETAPVVAPELPKFDPAPLLDQLGRQRAEIERLEATIAETEAAMEAARVQRQREIEEDDMRIISLLEMLEDG